jgi:hypothetical protein
MYLHGVPSTPRTYPLRPRWWRGGDDQQELFPPHPPSWSCLELAAGVRVLWEGRGGAPCTWLYIPTRSDALVSVRASRSPRATRTRSAWVCYATRKINSNREDPTGQLQSSGSAYGRTMCTRLARGPGQQWVCGSYGDLGRRGDEEQWAELKDFGPKRILLFFIFFLFSFSLFVFEFKSEF